MQSGREGLDGRNCFVAYKFDHVPTPKKTKKTITREVYFIFRRFLQPQLNFQ